MWKSLKLDDGRQALLLDYPAKGEEESADEVNRNLVCIDDKGEVHWQVKPPLPFQPSGDPFCTHRKRGADPQSYEIFWRYL